MKLTTIFLLLLVSFFACTNSQQEHEELNTPSNTIKSSILIKNQTGESIGHINVSNLHEFSMDLAQVQLLGTLKGDKRRYSQNGKLLGAVKYNHDDALKLKNNEDELLWKIKFKEDKIKFQKAEEAQEPLYVLKIKDQKIKVLKGENTEIGSIELKNDVLNVMGNTSNYTIQYNKLSPAFGVLLMDDFSNTDKAIMIAELLAKG